MIRFLKLVYDKDYRDRFQEEVADILNVKSLERLHEHGAYSLFDRENDQSSDFHQRFYANNENFLVFYERFMRNEIRHLFGEQIVYQKIPTLRVHLPGNVAVGEFHRDVDYGHSTNAINFWIPLTPVNQENTVWIEHPFGDCEPMVAQPGEMIIFDGANIPHGNYPNLSKKTRVSFDFRVFPESLFEPQPDRGSINTNMKFVIGDYFEKTVQRLGELN